MVASLPASFHPDDSVVETGPAGQRGHRDLIAHTAKFERTLHKVRPGVWSMVGNGLSNQNFVEGPDGIIAIDTGESNEEMAAALADLRQETDKPIVAVVYTHFHYVAGTQAILDEPGTDPDIPIWGHIGIVDNLARMGSEVSAAASRGLVHQFGMLLPPDGPDAVINVGLGLEFRSTDHAPFTKGFVPPTHTIDADTSTTLAGLDVQFTLAPSDADDSITAWFPALGVAAHNIAWPALFNVFAIRGEEYRDPRVLLTGLDHLIGLGADHLIATHGPPLSEAAVIEENVTEFRDSIQFMWDQTVRGLNRGLTVDELTEFVQLPDLFNRTFMTRQFYGVVEHHVRQIHAGLRGWFDGHEALMFPVPPVERAQKLIAGFGGADAVREQATSALADGEVRWALELASWLVRSEVDDRGRVDGGTDADRRLLARVLRTVGQRTMSSNVRNQCLTRALELEGAVDVTRFRTHRIARGEVLANPPELFVRGLRVLLDPLEAEGIDDHLRWEFADGTRVGLHVRRQVAVPTDGSAADLAMSLDLTTWAELVSGKLDLSEAIAAGSVSITGDERRVTGLLAAFDHPTLRA